MIEAVALAQSEQLSTRPQEERKELGQYFTGSATADYMASLISPNPSYKRTLRLLDAGAGLGILTISAALRCLELGYKDIHTVLYEIDNSMTPGLNANMEDLQSLFERHNAALSFEVLHKDFVLDRPDKAEEKFDIASINPPYFKFNTKTSIYAKETNDLYSGNPNIYASFLAIVAECMSANGQMISITPRSFTNGLYFKGFRRFLNKTMSLENIHIFGSRNKVFREASVLQENIICKHIKRSQIDHVEVRTSKSQDDLNVSTVASYPSSLIIDSSNEHEIIRVPETTRSGKALKKAESWKNTFSESGYFISTGPVVEHRTRNFICSPSTRCNSVPLLRMHNVRNAEVNWDGSHKKDAKFKLIEDHEKHTTENRLFILVKRFSSKDEKRRLVACVYDPSSVQGNTIALENHLNYIGKEDDTLNYVEAHGLCALLNSTFMDTYFRCISGNTQVNATEVRLMKIPTTKTIAGIGREVRTLREKDQASIDHIVNNFLQVS